MGHSSVSITEQHYAALSNQSARDAISILDVLNDEGLETTQAAPSPRKAFPQEKMIPLGL